MKIKHAFLKSAAILAILFASQAQADVIVFSLPS